VAKLKRSSLFTLSSAPKISEALSEFVEPVLAMMPGVPIETVKEIFSVAVMVWNAVLLDGEGHAHYLDDARTLLRGSDDQRGREFMQALVEDLADRKRTEFADDRRLIGDWQIIAEHDGGFRLRAEARALRPKSPAAEKRS
jgi:hypothetical protein